MNTRLLKILLAVQALFAAGLIVIGVTARDNRRMEYLELTRRVSAGLAKNDDFVKLAARMPDDADTLAIRALFGPPLKRSSQLDVGANAQETPERRTGDFWLYYPSDSNGYPIDYDALSKLKGPVQCFVFNFDEKGFGRGELLWVQHPIAGATP